MNQRPKKERTGLKAFSTMILSILQKEKSIEYTKVADIIMAMSEGTGDDKNVKRRVYDALNVMCAVDLVRKDRKMAYLTDNQLCSCEMEVEKRLIKLGQSIISTPKLRERVEEKRRVLEETIKRKELLVRLIERNKQREYLEEKEKLHLPFILISTKKKSRIDCETNDKRSYFKFIFTSPYKIYEDVHILKQIFGEKEARAEVRESRPFGDFVDTLQTENMPEPTHHAPNPQWLPKAEIERITPGSPLGSSYIFTEDDDWLNLYNFLN
ncbi:transcription factor Dp-1 [Nematocida minor]|uniref:transcription factor Dp-1 n=1 Tax=Nematocida minor TaxID=1912983 RepID=UPI0022211285|nr:transcription factor Dp-1 [Nematocida minor]KAI5190830.1 transcription factor Dp-1 [Nematocida minor]